MAIDVEWIAGFSIAIETNNKPRRKPGRLLSVGLQLSELPNTYIKTTLSIRSRRPNDEQQSLFLPQTDTSHSSCTSAPQVQTTPPLELQHTQKK